MIEICTEGDKIFLHNLGNTEVVIRIPPDEKAEIPKAESNAELSRSYCQNCDRLLLQDEATYCSYCNSRMRG